MVLGLAALLLFNMTMPITLYQLVIRHRQLAGFFFGLLTLALFLGFLPGYLGYVPRLPGPAAGALWSLVSLALLAPVCEGRKAGMKRSRQM